MAEFYVQDATKKPLKSFAIFSEQLAISVQRFTY